LASSRTAEVHGLCDVDHEARVNFLSRTVQQLTLFLNMLFIAHVLNFLIVLKIVLSQDNVPFT